VELAKMVDVHQETLWRYMCQHGIERQYSNLRDCDLDALVKVFKCRRPESSFRYLVGFLQQQGVRVQHRRIWQSLQRVDRIGQHLRQCNTQVGTGHISGRNHILHSPTHFQSSESSACLSESSEGHPPMFRGPF
ncbi:hypothetical protein EV424DRAFT_1321233, partial [Suillus variegatus]